MGRTSSASTQPGDCPQLATPADKRLDFPSGRTHAARTSSKRPGKINLKAVAEACIDEGLDPAAEIARVLQASTPLTKNGKEVLDDNGNPIMVPLVDADTRLRTLNELLQYVQPKLKSVEVKMSGALELSNEQLDQRLAALIAKAAK